MRRLTPSSTVSAPARLTSLRAYTVLLGGLLAISALPATARADHGRFNLHLDLGAGIPYAGQTRPGAGSGRSGGAIGYFGADLVLAQPVAIEVIMGLGGFAKPFPRTFDGSTRLRTVAAGVPLVAVQLADRLESLVSPAGVDAGTDAGAVDDAGP